MSKQRELFGFTGAGDAAGNPDRRRRSSSVGKPQLTPGSAVLTRLVEASHEIATDPSPQITYQHTVLCQTGMPYRSQGDDVRLWEQRNGRVYLRIEAGSALHPIEERFVPLPLPFGPKARLILIHLNGEALRTGSATIEVEDSMTAFVKRLLRRDPNGREIGSFKSQLGALSASLVRLATIDGHRTVQIDTKVVTAFDLWAPADARQQILWPSTIQLSEEYFASLGRHAVPLDERAVAALAHSAQGLDVYAWLAQRLHRVARAGARNSSRGRRCTSSSGTATGGSASSERSFSARSPSCTGNTVRPGLRRRREAWCSGTARRRFPHGSTRGRRRDEPCG